MTVLAIRTDHFVSLSFSGALLLLEWLLQAIPNRSKIRGANHIEFERDRLIPFCFLKPWIYYSLFQLVFFKGEKVHEKEERKERGRQKLQPLSTN